MSASQAPVFDAIALQFVAALEAYDRDVGRLIAAWPDPQGYREVSDGIDALRMYSAALPASRVQWVEVLIAHAELVQCLWRAQPGAPDAAAKVAALREVHRAAIAALRDRCVWAMADNRPAA